MSDYATQSSALVYWGLAVQPVGVEPFSYGATFLSEARSISERGTQRGLLHRLGVARMSSFGLCLEWQTWHLKSALVRIADFCQR